MIPGINFVKNLYLQAFVFCIQCFRKGVRLHKGPPLVQAQLWPRTPSTENEGGTLSSLEWAFLGPRGAFSSLEGGSPIVPGLMGDMPIV